MSDHGLEKELERVSSLKDAGSFGGQQPRGEEFTVLGLVILTDLSPLDGGASTSLGGVVCWFDAFVFEEGEQTVPVLQQALARLTHVAIRAVGIVLEAFVHASPDRNGFRDKGLPVQISTLERMPERKHSSIGPVSESIHLENLAASGHLQACLIPLIPLMIWAQ